MTKYLVILTLLIPSLAMSEDTILDLGTGDSVYATCTGVDCPDCPPTNCPPADLGFPFGHGGSHMHEAKRLRDSDCRDCHGQDLMGSAASVTSKNVSCIAPDGLVLPNGVDTVPIERANGEILDNYEGTSTGILPKGLPVSCGYCHKEVEYKFNGQEVKGKFEDWRKANGGGEDDD